jgi:hypothetical protein
LKKKKMMRERGKKLLMEKQLLNLLNSKNI